LIFLFIHNSHQHIIKNDASKIITNSLEIGNEFKPFYTYETFSIPPNLFEILQSRKLNDKKYIYLVILNDNSASYFKPFYIESDKQIKTIHYQGKELLFEEIQIKYVKDEIYFDNGMEKSTFLFTTSKKNKMTVDDFEIENGDLIIYRGSSEIVNIPLYVSSIQYIAFMGAKNPIKSIYIPCTTSLIDDYFNMRSIEDIAVSPLNQTFTAINGILYTKDISKLLRYPSMKSGDSFVIPLSVTTIEGKAFRYCVNLVSVTIPETVTKIGSYAFTDCSKLQSVNIPSSITELEDSLFSSCSSLETVLLPDSITKIGKWTFSQCVNLKSITIPSSVESIAWAAFSQCDNLKTVKLSRKTQIEIGAFPEGVLFEYVD
jgi:hypothetical protein